MFWIYHHILIKCRICRLISIHFNVFRMIKNNFVFFFVKFMRFFYVSYKLSFFNSFDASSSSDFINKNVVIVIIFMRSMTLFDIIIFFWWVFFWILHQNLFFYIWIFRRICLNWTKFEVFFLNVRNWNFFWIINWFVDCLNDFIFEKNMN